MRFLPLKSLQILPAGIFVCMSLVSIMVLNTMSCNKRSDSFQPSDSLGRINKWVYDSMDLYYYWRAEMPRQPDYTLPTPEFFKRLLSSEDRFSYISNRSDIGAAKTTVSQFGFHYALITHPFDAQKLVGVITLVVSGSNADRVKLKRGTFFTQINNKVITPENMATLTQQLNTNPAAMLRLAQLNNTGTALDDSVQVAVQSDYVPVKSVYGRRIFQHNGIKTGYLAYFLCAEKDDAFLLQCIQQLKDAGITELVLDLRYNMGGSVASATKLAATLVPSFNPDNIFITYNGNQYGGTVKQSFRKTISFSGDVSGKDMTGLLNKNLGLSRIFILTSPITASAAELLANNLKPFMQVVMIGEQTHGKDEASFPIEDKTNPQKVAWLIMPTIYKVADANNKGNYSNGIPVNYTVNDFISLPLADFGLPGDQSVDKALVLIYGTTAVDVTNLRKKPSFSFPGTRIWYRSPGAGLPVLSAP